MISARTVAADLHTVTVGQADVEHRDIRLQRRDPGRARRPQCRPRPPPRSPAAIRAARAGPGGRSRDRRGGRREWECPSCSHERPLPCSAADDGTRQRTVVPPSGADSMSHVPPCATARCSRFARPLRRATSRGIPMPSSVTRSSTPLRRREHLHVHDLRARVTGRVRQRLAQHRQQIGHDLRVDAGIDRTVERDVRSQAGPLGNLFDQVEDLGAEPGVLMGFQGEDAGPDLADRLVDLVDGLDEPGPVRLRRARRDGLEHHADREQALDDGVVQVASDAFPIFEPVEQIAVVATAGQLDGERRLAGKGLDDQDLRLAETDARPSVRPTRRTPRRAS